MDNYAKNYNKTKQIIKCLPILFRNSIILLYTSTISGKKQFLSLTFVSKLHVY